MKWSKYLKISLCSLIIASFAGLTASAEDNILNISNQVLNFTNVPTNAEDDKINWLPSPTAVCDVEKKQYTEGYIRVNPNRDGIDWKPIYSDDYISTLPKASTNINLYNISGNYLWSDGTFGTINTSIKSKKILPHQTWSPSDVEDIDIYDSDGKIESRYEVDPSGIGSFEITLYERESYGSSLKYEGSSIYTYHNASKFIPDDCKYCGENTASNHRFLSTGVYLEGHGAYGPGSPNIGFEWALRNYIESLAITNNVKIYSKGQTKYVGANIENCTANATIYTNPKWYVKSGVFKGSPAVTGGAVIRKGTITDTNNTSSTFTVDYDSEIKSKTTDANGVTTYTINLSNPPIIIDWDDFPGIELPEMDFAAPVITVTREPSSTLEATKQVKLTIKATDPNGHDHEKPISINGGDYVASPATYTVTENQAVSVVAQDTFGNIREMVVNVNNIDNEVPVITNIEQNSDKWTRDSVKLTVTATDDVKLHKTSAYRYQFTPNDKSKQSTDTGWVASRFFTVTEAGTVTITVRDSLGNESKPEIYNVVNIDKISPTATFTISPSDKKVSEKEGVLVSLKLVDTPDSVTNESSGMASLAVKWDENSSWEEATEKKFYENGVYTVKVRDAVGNVSEPIQITVSNISSDKPVITSFKRDKTDNGYVTSPVTITVTASANGGLHDRPYSWDGGKTWTSVNSLKVYENKEYGVMVRDKAGNTAEAFIPILNIDSVKPTGSMYMVKGVPNEDPDAAPEDWVWKLRIEADDIGSGVSAVDTLWDGQSYTSTPVVIEISEAGIYGVTITDKAGNQSYVEKVITEEAIGGAGGSGNGEYVDIKVPENGSAGDYFNAALGDLVYGKQGAYNKVTKEFKNYQSSERGITVNVVVGSKSGRYITGTVNFNNVDYKLKFNGGEEVAKGRKSIPASVFIPAENLTTDINNGRIRITVKEYSDSSLSKHVRDGVAQLYTNVQVTDPTLIYTYDSVADKLTISAVSTVAGIKGIAYDIGGGSQSYSEPISIGNASNITMVAEDNVQGRVTITKTAEELELGGGGGGSLPTESNDGSVNVMYQSSSSFESYIIGGSKTNTKNLPDSSIYDELLGN